MFSLSPGALRLRAAAQIDQAAAEARMRHASAAAGLDMVYAAKLAQAQAYLAARQGNPQAAVPPYVQADVEVDGGSAAAAALAIVRAAEAFHSGPGPAIERVRRGAKAALKAAKSADELERVLADVLAELAAI